MTVNTHIWCTWCGTIQPLKTHEMGGEDMTGQYTGATDLLCAVCYLIIATTYRPKEPKPE